MKNKVRIIECSISQTIEVRIDGNNEGVQEGCGPIRIIWVNSRCIQPRGCTLDRAARLDAIDVKGRWDVVCFPVVC